jgi:hypothetical protein
MHALTPPTPEVRHDGSAVDTLGQMGTTAVVEVSASS